MAAHEPGAIGIAAMALHGALLRGLVTNGVLTQDQANAVAQDAIKQVEANPDLKTRGEVIQVFRDIGMISG